MFSLFTEEVSFSSRSFTSSSPPICATKKIIYHCGGFASLVVVVCRRRQCRRFNPRYFSLPTLFSKSPARVSPPRTFARAYTHTHTHTHAGIRAKASQPVIKPASRPQSLPPPSVHPFLADPGAAPARLLRVVLFEVKLVVVVELLPGTGSPHSFISQSVRREAACNRGRRARALYTVQTLVVYQYTM